MPHQVSNGQLSSAMEKGIPFTLKAGNVKYRCSLQDRHAYERVKAKRTDSAETSSDESGSTTPTGKSS